MEEAVTQPILKMARLPGKRYRIPSRNIFYTNNEIDAEMSEEGQDGEVEIFSMTALDEILFKTPDKLINGDAIAEVFMRCIPAIKKPKDLFYQDVSFLLICLRAVSFGDSVDVKHKHTCENAKEHKYTFNLSNFINKTKNIDPTAMDKFTYKMENGQEVTFRPLTFRGYIDLVDIASNSDEIEDDSAFITKLMNNAIKSLCELVLSVDGITDKEQIYNWITSLPIAWLNDLRERVASVNEWGTNTEVEFKCKDCGTKFKHQLDLNPLNFFS